jgi:hypothetical protein
MKARSRVAAVLGGFSILLIGCGTSMPAPGGAAFTETAPPIAPTSITHSTPVPTGVSTVTPALTAEFTPTGSSLPLVMGTTTTETAAANDWSCRVLSQSVRNGTHFGPKERFDIGWRVRNNGTATWDPSTMDFVYFSGTKMYQAPHYNLPAVVGRGETVALGAGMLAPRSSGSYATVWSLRSGKDFFCHVSLRIIVP